MSNKSKEAKDIITSLKNGVLPPLITPQSDTCTKTNGVEASQRGLEKTTFGLQSITESKD